MLTKKSLVPKMLFFVALLYSIALLIFSFVNLKSLPTLEITNADKIYHSIAYCGLIIVWYLQYFVNTAKKWYARPLLIICGLAVAFGIIIEILQGTMTSYRNWDNFDMLANLIGVLVGFALLYALRNPLERLKMKI